MYNRSQYINGECTHEQYYNQFVTDAVMNVVKTRFTIAQLKTAYEQDPHLNTIKLPIWDSLAFSIKQLVNFKDKGDAPNLAGLVCIGKAAARKLVEMA